MFEGQGCYYNSEPGRCGDFVDPGACLKAGRCLHGRAEVTYGMEIFSASRPGYPLMIAWKWLPQMRPPQEHADKEYHLVAAPETNEIREWEWVHDKELWRCDDDEDPYECTCLSSREAASEGWRYISPDPDIYD